MTRKYCIPAPQLSNITSAAGIYRLLPAIAVSKSCGIIHKTM